MNNILTLLGVTESQYPTLPKDIIQASRLIDGFQIIYENMPEGQKKDMFATSIAESVKIVIKRLAAVGIGNIGLIKKENAQLPQAMQQPIPTLQPTQYTPPAPQPAPTPKKRGRNPGVPSAGNEKLKKLADRLRDVEL